MVSKFERWPTDYCCLLGAPIVIALDGWHWFSYVVLPRPQEVTGDGDG